MQNTDFIPHFDRQNEVEYVDVLLGNSPEDELIKQCFERFDLMSQLLGEMTQSQRESLIRRDSKQGAPRLDSKQYRGSRLQSPSYMKTFRVKSIANLATMLPTEDAQNVRNPQEMKRPVKVKVRSMKKSEKKANVKSRRPISSERARWNRAIEMVLRQNRMRNLKRRQSQKAVNKNQF